MLIPSRLWVASLEEASLSRRVNANSQLVFEEERAPVKLIKKGEC